MTAARASKRTCAIATLAILTACSPKNDGGAGGTAATAPRPAPIITLDSHDDIPLDFATPAVDPATADLQVNLDKMKAGGLNAGFFIVYVGQSARTDDNYAHAQADALTKFAAIHRMAEELYPRRIEIAYHADDVGRIVAAGKLVAAIGIENGFVLGRNLEMLDRYYELGARYVTLSHDGNNDLAGSARPKPELGDPDTTSGVTALGAEAIARMNRLGIMVDISHGSKQTALDAMRLSAAPVIASHSGIAGVSVHPRNLDDETLRALRDDGGVVQVVAYDAYLRHQSDEELAALRTLRERVGLTAGGPGSLPPDRRAEYENGLREIQAQWPPATVKTFVDHIDYAVKLIGVDHVGISSDFGGGGGVTGWNDASETGNVTAELRARGYSDADIGKIWSGNLLRVWRAAEQTAAQLKAAPH
ncbi:MAG TPA: dipeptidase [Gammaproteobacteria bacterium]|jgi:membrane dipeptidase|nr:dipeptidase [Gammaproteobacteria bacterium]